MHRFLSAVPALLLAACAGAPSMEDLPAPRFQNLGDHHHPITTSKPDAQRYFDQGLTLAFAFNHLEAERSFRYAAKLDPDCAMCWWGVAFVLGPNINVPMMPDAGAPAWQAVQNAKARRDKASPAERAYIDAIAMRYTEQPPQDRTALDAAFARAAGAVAKRFPKDLDAGALYAEALMDQHPWDYYDTNGRAKRGDTHTIVATLERVLKADPKHAWAQHLYIHATEASTRPERAERYADMLGGFAPDAGHLVHMPGHTYMRVGRYHDAVVANQLAARADDSYIAQCHAQGVYAIGYVPHNHHFLWAAAGFEGNSELALSASTQTQAHVGHGMLHDPGFGGLAQNYEVQPLFARVRFGRWEELLSADRPPDDLLYPLGIWHYARGRALVGVGKLEEAQEQLAALVSLAQSKDVAALGPVGFNPPSALLQVAGEVLEGEIVAAQGDYRHAIRHLTNAVKHEDALTYDEPADWSYPVRHSLGAVLLVAGKPKEAERVYREDLKRNRENGWALFGLKQSLEAQHRDREAAAVAKRFEKAWQHADVELTSSRF